MASDTDRNGVPTQHGEAGATVPSSSALRAVLLASLSLVACGGGEQRTVDHGSRTPPESSGRGPTFDICLPVERLLRLDVGGGGARAAILGKGRTGVVFANQIENTVCSWHGLPEYLAAHGMRVIVFDYARSDRSASVLAASRVLARLDAKRFVLIGSSIGGPVVLHAATRAPEPPAAIVALSPAVDSVPYPTRQDVRTIKVPTLYVTAAAEAETSRALYGSTAARSKRLIVVPGAEHGTALLVQPRQGGRVTRAILRFIEANS